MKKVLSVLIAFALGVAFGYFGKPEKANPPPAAIAKSVAPPACAACPVCPAPPKPGQPPIPPSLVLQLMRDCEAGRLDFSTPNFAIRRSSP